MNIPQFRRWIKKKVDCLHAFPEGVRNSDGWLDLTDLLNEARCHALDLELPEAAAAADRPGPAIVRLREVLHAIPAPERVDGHSPNITEPFGVSP